MHTTARPAALLLLSPLLAVSFGAVSASPAEAATPRCEGEKATIVSSRRQVRGTGRADVIVATNRGVFVTVEARGGDDIVCLRGHGEVDAGSGNDLVRMLGKAGGEADLGPGDDTFIGGSGNDILFAFSARTAQGRDDIRTRGGDDLVDSGWRGELNRDTVDLGGGDDRLTLAGDSTNAVLEGGPGGDSLSGFHGIAGGEPGSVTVDNGSRRATVDGIVVADGWSGFDAFSFSATGLAEFVGGADDEEVTVYADRVRASMGDGDDTVSYRKATPELLDGGPGLDRLDVYYESRRSDTITGSLVTDRIDWQAYGATGSVTFLGMEGLGITSLATTTLHGDEGANDMSVTSCAGTIHGGAGDDRLANDGYFDIDDDAECGAVGRAVLHGEAGDDRLVGGEQNDSLDGGDGTDSADGRRGRDACVAETRTRCET